MTDESKTSTEWNAEVGRLLGRLLADEGNDRLEAAAAMGRLGSGVVAACGREAPSINPQRIACRTRPEWPTS
jgi:hypothetical protein